MACAIPRCEHVKERIGRLPASFAADAGYGSEGNCAYLEREGADAYVKHNEFFRIKRNLGFTRFTLRGLEKVTLEWRLVAAGHNIRKLFLAECEKGKMAAGAMA